MSVDETIIVAVADGAGSAEMGGEGASLLCRTMATRAHRHLLGTGSLPTDGDIWSWVDEARDRIGRAAENCGADVRDFATTMVVAFSSGKETLVAHVGDGCAVVRLTADDRWVAVSWPDQGEYASTTFFVTDVPTPRLRIMRIDEPISAIGLMTDGLERLALDFGRNVAHAPFFDGMIKPIENQGTAGKAVKLSRALAQFLDSPAVLERTDDDKTLILAAIER